MQVIVYNQDNGIPAVVMPTEEALQQHGIMAIAIKDVPAGKRFKIVGASDISSDRTERDDVFPRTTLAVRFLCQRSNGDNQDVATT